MYGSGSVGSSTIGLDTKKGFAYAGTEDMKRGIPEVPLWRLYEYNFADTDG